MVLVQSDLRGGGVRDAEAGKGAAVMDETKFDNEKLLRRRIRELEELLGLRDEEQRRMDREDEQVFRLVHGPKLPMSGGEERRTEC